MDKTQQATLRPILNAYATYFVSDFATAVSANLEATMPVDVNVFNSVMNEVVPELVGDRQVYINSTDSFARFLCECAIHAITSKIQNPESREAFDAIKDLPSQHHDEIQQAIFHASQLYSSTLDGVVLSTIALDADTAFKTIVSKSEARIATTETGGRVNIFNWGILNDGMWLNAALQKAFDEAKIFRPGEPVTAYYATTAFAVARQKALLWNVGHLTPAEIDGYLHLLSAHDESVGLGLEVLADGDFTFRKIAFTAGRLAQAIDVWEASLRDPRNLIKSVTELSQHVETITKALELTRTMSEGLIDDAIADRLQIVSDAITMVLVGFESARESRFAETLIFYVDGVGEDPTVDVFVNADTLPAFLAAGGEESDLPYLGLYLDPRKTDLPTPSNGYPISFGVKRRAELVPEMMAQSAERIEQLRANDAHVIRSIAVDTLTPLVKSYASAAVNTAEFSNSLMVRIHEIANAITRSDSPETPVEAQILQLLATASGDPFVKTVADTFEAYSLSEETTVAEAARPLTIANVAARDCVAHLFAD